MRNLCMAVLLLAICGGLQAEPLTGAIEGKVVDSRGKPLQGIRVEADRPFKREWAYTTADGSFVIKKVPPGTWDVNAGQDGRWFPPGRKAVVRPGKTTRVPAIPALATAKVEGQVVYADTGKSAAGVQIDIKTLSLPYAIAWSVYCYTDATGAFTGVTPVGRNEITADDVPEGYIADPWFQKVTVPASGLSGLRIELAKAIGRGKIVDSAGRAVANASVRLFGEEKGCTASADGSFQLALPTPAYARGNYFFLGNDLIVSAESRAHRLKALRVVTLGEMLKGTAVVVLRPPMSTKVRVSLPSGKPAVGAGIRRIPMFSNEGDSTGDIPETDAAHTDSRGNAQVGGMIAGARYLMVASLPGFYDRVKHRMIVTEGELPKVVNITLVPATRVQKGRVIDEDGKPVAGAEVRAERFVTIATTKTDKAGRFTLRNLPDDALNIEASESHRTGSQTVDKHTGPVTITINRAMVF